jgi:hypothetical protein
LVTSTLNPLTGDENVIVRGFVYAPAASVGVIVA